MINDGDKEDVEALKVKLKELIENKALRQKYREKAWPTIKNFWDKKMAREICNVYYKLIGKPFVSIIIPTFDRPEVLIECLEGAITQDYLYKEIVVVDSGNTKIEKIIEKIRQQVKVPIRYIYFDNKEEFTLPKARNLGVMEAQGEYLVFCDERIRMVNNAVSEFVKHTAIKTWLYGIKDDAKKSFVENFSCISKQDLVMTGMFNERINCYGGSSQELRQRFGMNGFIFEYVATAKAYQIAKSSAKFIKKTDIMKSKFNIYRLYN